MLKVMMFPQTLLNLHLTVAIIVLIATGSLFGVIAENVVSGGALTIIDAQLAQWLHVHSVPALTQCLLILTHMHDPIVISLVVVVIALYLILKKSWYATWILLLVVQGGMLFNLLAKHMFQRARPSFEHPLVILTTYSFPSGHVAATTLFYGALATLLISQTVSWIRVVGILLIAVGMIVIVAFSRLYLGAHYLSDVLAAFFEGIAWLALCLTAIQIYRIYREKYKLH